MNSDSVNSCVSQRHLPTPFSCEKRALAQRRVATQELLLAEAIPAGFNLSAGESSTVEVHLGNVLNRRIWSCAR